MKIKSFIASTVQEALKNVKKEMGEDSIILETRNIEEGDIKSRDEKYRGRRHKEQGWSDTG